MGILIVLILLFVLKTKWDTLVEFLAQYIVLCAQSSYLVNSKYSIHFIVILCILAKCGDTRGNNRWICRIDRICPSLCHITDMWLFSVRKCGFKKSLDETLEMEAAL